MHHGEPRDDGTDAPTAQRGGRCFAPAGARPTEKCFDDALQLARKNPKRYKLHAEEEHKKLYVRRRGKLIVEMVLFMVSESHFSLINLTGNMNEKFLEQLMQL